MAAAALTGPLAWELPKAMGVALKRKKKKKKKRKENKLYGYQTGRWGRDKLVWD